MGDVCLMQTCRTEPVPPPLAEPYPGNDTKKPAGQYSEKYNVATLTAADVAELASRLEQDDYTNAFAGLEDWHLLRSIAFQRPELVEPYIHLLDLEAYDEA